MQAIKPKITEPKNDTKLLSTIDINKQANERNAVMPEKIVRRSDAPMFKTRMIASKVLSFILCSGIKKSDDFRTFDCYARCVTMKIALDLSCLDMVVKGRSSNA